MAACGQKQGFPRAGTQEANGGGENGTNAAAQPVQVGILGRTTVEPPINYHFNSRTQLRSVRQFLREEVVRHEETSTADHIVLTPEQEEAEFQKCLDVNAAWNAAIAKERDQRLAKEREDKVAYVQERLEARQLREEERREQANQRVLREIELSKTYITRENLDAAIEAALANPVDHNFAIDLAGNLYCGRNTSQLPDANPNPEPNQQALSN